MTTPLAPAGAPSAVCFLAEKRPPMSPDCSVSSASDLEVSLDLRLTDAMPKGSCDCRADRLSCGCEPVSILCAYRR